jgi:uncharacterized SAM-binding protein YcdF (DUF218 family)
MKSLAALLVVAIIWLAGLMAFADRVQRQAPPSPTPHADGIVALTGKSEARIQEAMSLLQQGKARRLLVSGVNREVTRPELRDVTAAPSRLYDCCVDLGFDAENTLGNAQEIAAWTKAKGFKSLIVVTSDYHMPRSLLEIRSALPGVKLIAYPVATPSLDAHRWWRSGTGAKFMTLEYTKYLVVLGREGIIKLGEAFDGKPSETEKAEAKAAAEKAARKAARKAAKADA